MKMNYLVTGYDIKTDRLSREFDIDERAFWSLRSRRLPRFADDGWGCVPVDRDDIRSLVSTDDLDRFEWFVEAMVEDPDAAF